MSYSSVKDSVSRRAAGLLALAQRQVDRVVSPEARRKTYNAVVAFANERPFLAAFIFTHLFFSCTPLLIFSIFILSTATLALGTALLFTLFWLGVALLVLVPALMLTSAVAFAAYAWGLSSYFFVRQVSGWVPGLEGRLWGKPLVNGDGSVGSPPMDGGPVAAANAGAGTGNAGAGNAGAGNGGNGENMGDGYLL